MPQSLVCPQGHRWESVRAGDVAPPTCPICGNAPSSPTLDEAQNTADHVAEPSAPEKKPAAAVAIPGYEILGVLGRGGMGVVYKARHIKLKRLVALKMILAGAHAGPSDLERFRLEAEAVARLQHPNVVQIYEVGEHEGRPYFSLEFVDGGSLQHKLGGTPLPPRAAAELVATLARAMYAAHELRVIHRDLKPANVLLTKDGIPKITDFGLAKQLGQDSGQTHSGQIMGTPSYMAPEQAAGNIQALGPAADIYALGAMLYETLTGRPPFKAAAVLDTLEQVRTQEPVPPSQLQPKTPRDLETICLKCLQKDPTKRYASAAALADDVQRYLNGEPVHARPVGQVERFSRWCQRNPVVAGLSAAVVFVLLTGTAVAWYLAVDAMEEKRRADTNSGTAMENLETAKANAALEVIARKDADRNAAQAKKNLTIADEHREKAETLTLRVQFEHYFAKAEERPDVTLIGLASALPKMSQRKDRSAADPFRVQIGASSERVHHLKGVYAFNGSFIVHAMSADGKTALTGGVGNTVQLWETVTGKPLGPPMQHHQRHVRAVALSADGKTALTGSDDRTARLWEVATGKPIGLPLQYGTEVWGVALSADGKTAMARGNSMPAAHVWDTATGKLIGLGLQHQQYVLAMALSPDGKTALTGSQDKTARLWDTTTGKPIGQPLQHDDSVFAVALSADGKTALTGSQDKTARLWDAATGKPIGQPLQHHRTIRAVALSADAMTALTGSDDQAARLWDTVTGKPIGPPLQHPSLLGAVALSADGKTALTQSGDQTVRLWAVASGRPNALSLPHSDAVDGVALSADGTTALTGSFGKTAQLWDTVTGKPIGGPLQHGFSVHALALSADGTIALTGGDDKQKLSLPKSKRKEHGTGRLWDAATGRPIGQLLEHQAPVFAVALSADGRTALTVSHDRTCLLWKMETGKPIGLKLLHESPVNRVALSGDGKTALTVSTDFTARLWETATGKPIGTTMKHDDLIYVVVLSADGTTALTGGKDKTARLWETATGKPIGQPLQHQGTVLAVALSADGKSALTASTDHTARLWDTATGTPIGLPLQHQDQVNAVALSADGKTAVTGSSDSTARLWETTAGKPIGPPLQHQDKVSAVALSADGRMALTGSKDKTARLWKVPHPSRGEPERIMLWAQVITGLEVDELTAVRVLDAGTWQQRRQRLQELGGPPE